MKKKVENERLNFENPIFWCFPDFLQNFAVNDFLKSFAEWLTRFWFFSFLKIIFRHWIWNEIPDLEQNCCFKIFFVCFVEMDFWSLSLFFLALVALKCFRLCFSLWECFLGGCRFENISCRFRFFFGAYRFENYFLLLLLWKLFLPPVALKHFCRLPLWKCFLFLSLWILFWALVALKILFWHLSLFENFWRL